MAPEVLHVPAGQAPQPGPAWLGSTRFLDHDTPALRDAVAEVTRGAADAREKAVRLYYSVRDGLRYDPFSVRTRPEQFVASTIRGTSANWCVPKAILLTAMARGAGIHAGIGLSDVVNHLSTEKLREKMGGKTTFLHHGYAVLYLEGKWVKAAPAFNIELCDRFGVLPTEFDGRGDAVFQPYDAMKRRHMEYVADHGVWSEFPHEMVIRDFRAYYPQQLFADEPGADADGERFEDGRRLA
jgi:transglutaminase-like putative cysteine protease